MPMVPECPTTEILERLLLGQLTTDEASTLELHVAACPRCGRTFHGIRAEDDLVAAMQEAATVPPVASDAAEALIPWLKRLRPKDATRTVLSAGWATIASCNRSASAAWASCFWRKMPASSGTWRSS